MQHNLVETLVGAFVIAVSAIFLSYGYSVSDMSPKSGYKLIAEFDRIDGLTVGSDVRMSGIKVGTVIDQKLNKQNWLEMEKGINGGRSAIYLLGQIYECKMIITESKLYELSVNVRKINYECDT